MTTTTPKNTKKSDSPLSSSSPASTTPPTGSSGTTSTPDTRDLFVQEYEFIVDKTGESTTVQYFCNRENEPVYFPDRTLATLFQVNLSTLRGRFNRMTKKHEGYRLLISEKSKTRLSSLHFINWGSENFVDTNTEGVRGSASPLHGLVALNHIILVNYALAEWIAYNHERLGTSLAEIESNLKKVNLSYTRTNNVINILQKRPSGFTPPIPAPSTSSKPSTTSTHPSMTGMYRSTMNTATSNAMGITNGDRMVPRRPSEDDLLPLFSPLSSPSTSPTQPHPLINPSNTIHSIPRKRIRDDWCSPLSSVKQPTNDLVPVHSQQTLPSFSAYNFSKYLKLEREPVFPSAPASNDNHEHNNDNDNEHGYDSESGSPRPPSSPKRWPVDNTIQCILEGELDLSCLEGFAALKAALSTLFRVNSFNILYQTILDSGYQELGVKDNGDEEKWLQFLAIVKKICVKPFSVTPQLKNLLS